MAYAGEILENPVSGELLAFELLLAPGAHVHPRQKARFEVVEGTMKLRRGRTTVFARAGEEVA